MNTHEGVLVLPNDEHNQRLVENVASEPMGQSRTFRPV
ncbi:MAG: hypothetical protein KatS3mg082_2083 [Nitrospiraceae bacterium]|nr:MAG: hypothetical protein KatS3mg082_2083 [Nitrospiraceae bacterium]